MEEEKETEEDGGRKKAARKGSYIQYQLVRLYPGSNNNNNEL